MGVFTSSEEEELNEADIQRKSGELTSLRFSARLDSKGRVTVPAKTRNRLGLESGDVISLEFDSTGVIRKSFPGLEEALNYLEDLETVESFRYDSGTLEVVLRD